MIDIAIDLLADLGYEGMSLQMIADAAQVTKAAVYYHFRTKGDLLDAILHQLFAHSPMIAEPATMRSRRSRLQWAAEQILFGLTTHRRVIAVVNGDPIIRKHPTFVALVSGTRERVLRIVYGENPSNEERAAFALATSAVYTLPDLEALSDDDLVSALRPAMYRTLGVPLPRGGTQQ